jgi:hypothetical protein
MTETKLVERKNRLEIQNRRLRKGTLLGALSVAVLLLISLTACEKEQSRKASSVAQAPIIERPYQRFLPIAHGQGFLSFPYWAFDTKTGQLCKTWDWHDMSAASRKAQQSGDTSKLTGLDAAAAGTPTCKQLWAESNQPSVESPAEWLKEYRARKGKGKDPLELLGPKKPPK